MTAKRVITSKVTSVSDSLLDLHRVEDMLVKKVNTRADKVRIRTNNRHKDKVTSKPSKEKTCGKEEDPLRDDNNVAHEDSITLPRTQANISVTIKSCT